MTEYRSDSCRQPGESSDQQRLSNLAVGFALGELTEPELQELYQRLQDSGDAGREAARTVWQTLTATMHLRSTVSPHFTDTVAHRLSESADQPQPEGKPSFMDSLAQRLGFSRPSLQEIALPSPRPQTRRWLLLATVVILLVLGGLWWLAGHGSRATIQALSGSVTMEGIALHPGTVLEYRPVILAPGSTLEIAWPEGHSVRLQGPASLVAHGSGLSLSSGQARIATTIPFVLGLPDGQVRAEEPAEFVVEVTGNRSCAGVLKGNLTATGSDDESRVIHTGEAAVPGLPAFSWQTSASLPAVENNRPARIYTIAFPADSSCWRIRSRIEWSNPEDEILMHAAARDGLDVVPVTIRPDRIIRRDDPDREQVILFSGAPLLPRDFVLQHLADGQTELQIAGNTITFPAGVSPGSIEVRGQTKLRVLAAFNGPAQLPVP